jgi:hypothetical protein
MDKFPTYRQPLVTATGILLGFMLNLGLTFAPRKSSIYDLKDVVAAVCLVVSATLLTIVLFRILNINYPQDKAKRYYNVTIRMFMVGLIFILIGLTVVIPGSFY